MGGSRFMLTLMNFKGKKALVTGGGRRIGKAISLSLAHAGADVAIQYFTSEKDAEETANAIRGMGRRSETTQMDLSDTPSVEKWFETLAKRWEGFDILINGASEYSEDNYENLTAEDLNRSMAVHVLSPLRMMRTMKGFGRESCIVNILDTRVIDRDPIHASYHLVEARFINADKRHGGSIGPPNTGERRGPPD